jgi:cystathionine beta-lyase family protein involved in aluminum resistance
MLTKVIDSYERIVVNIDRLIEVSGYRNDYIASKIGLTKGNFSAKKSRKSFSIDEIKRIVEVIENEDVDDYFMTLEMDRQKDD